MKTILITGGTGFLGRNLAPALKDKYNVILSGRNNGQNRLVEETIGCPVLPMDVASIEAVRDTFAEVRPNIVIHAAATKFVDLSERQPMECIDVNVIGSQNIARISIEKGVETVLGISTDKAAPPVGNTYGLSKALMERVFCSMNGKTDTKFACVRYGNVAWSTGSVFTIWKRMHDETNVIKTTGPEMRRFFFTADDAVNLVLTALENIDTIQGQILSRYMKSAQIEDLLETWTRAKGGSWERIAGRPGDLEDEFLIGETELPYASEKTFNNIRHFIISFNKKSAAPLPEILTSANTERLNEEEMLNLINSQIE